MAKCKYCYFKENGDIPSDRADLIYRKNVKLSDLELTCSEAKGILKFTKSFNVYNSIGSFTDGKVCLYLGCFDGETDEIVLEAERRINYCPMCGRKLN